MLGPDLAAIFRSIWRSVRGSVRRRFEVHHQIAGRKLLSLRHPHLLHRAGAGRLDGKFHLHGLNEQELLVFGNHRAIGARSHDRGEAWEADILDGYRPPTVYLERTDPGMAAAVTWVRANLSGDDVREGLSAVISVKLGEPQFEGQTKTKLGNSEVEGLVASATLDALSGLFEETPSIANKIIGKIIEDVNSSNLVSKAKR